MDDWRVVDRARQSHDGVAPAGTVVLALRSVVCRASLSAGRSCKTIFKYLTSLSPTSRSYLWLLIPIGLRQRRLFRILLRQRPTLLNLLEVATQRVTTRLLDDRRRFASRLCVVLLILGARVAVVFTFFLLLTLLAPIDVILELYPNLAFGRLFLDEGRLQQLFRVRPLMIVFHCTQEKLKVSIAPL
jgi:hypothetical protein